MTEGGPPGRSRASPSIPRVTGDRRSRRAPPVGPWSRPLSRPAEAERCFLCHSPTLRPWITDRWLRMCEVVAVLRGGALEPEPHTSLLENRRLKQTLIASVYFQRATLRVFLSQAGPRFDLELVQAEHHPWFRTLIDRPQTEKRRPCRVALVCL